MATSDISIVARDEASRALMAVADSVQTLNRHIFDLAGSTEGLKQAEANVSGFATGVKSAAAAAIAFLGGRQILGFANDAVEAFNVQNRAARSLADEHLAMAADMQVALGVGDEVTLGLMKQASILGVAESSLRDVSMAAIGLSEATGVGLNEALKKVNAAINGNAAALQDYMPELRNMTSEEAKLVAITELTQAGLQKKADSMQYLDGVMKGASNAVGDLYEKIGELLEPAVRLSAQSLTVFAEVATAAIIPAIDAMGAASEWWANATETASQYVVGAVTAVEVAFNNVGQIIELELLGAELMLRQFAGIAEHALTVQLPAYATWFAENWVDIFRDMGVAVVTIFDNIGHNIGEAAFALFDWISNGFEGGFDGLSERLGNAIFVGMMDGFEAKAKEMPQILGRAISDEEEALANKMAAIGLNLGGQFNDKFKSRMDALKLDKGAFDMNIDLSSTGKAAGDKATQELKAIESRLLTRGKAEDPINKVADNTAATAKELAGLRGDLRNKPQAPAVEFNVASA